MQPLTGAYSVMDVTAERFRPIFLRLRARVFADSFTFNAEGAMSQSERDATTALRTRLGDLFWLRMLIYHEQEVVGWHTGVQVSAYQFYMMSSGILPAHQGHGVYTALLPLVLARARDAGFQMVTSRHVMTNNQVLVPKLKAGFVINGFELDDTYGTLVRLAYYFNPIRRRALDFRAGQLIPDAELRRLLPLD